MHEGGLEQKPIFCPIICDFPQGMAVALPLRLEGTSLKQLEECYRTYYRGETLISVSTAPESGFLGSNAKAGRDSLEIVVCGGGDQALLVSRLDNLGKGAAGAAVQNMNLMLDLPEYTGLAL